MKGIILAGGAGTRLFPTTLAVSKQLIPVYDKPTIYYPLSTLMLSGIRDICIISTPRDLPAIESLLGNGDSLNISLNYIVQEKPEGIAQAFLLASDFIGDDDVCLILGDNIFHGASLRKHLEKASQLKKGAYIFAYHVNDPNRYGVVTFNQDNTANSIEEKPKVPKSNWAVTGLYFYDNSVVTKVQTLKKSNRGELEITDLNLKYLNEGQLQVLKLERGTAWLDTGTDESLLESSQYVQTIEKRQGLKISCIEEVALEMGFISPIQFISLAEKAPNSGYGIYLKRLAAQLKQ